MGESNPKNIFRLLSYNIHGCVGTNRKIDCQRTASVIAGINADIVNLQEVNVDCKPGERRSQAEIIGEMLHMKDVYFPVEQTGHHRHGLAVLSRLPIVDVHFLPLPNLYPWFNTRKRGAILATLDTSCGPVTLINTHLSVFKMERRKQLKALLVACAPALLPFRDLPMILCGDLNAGPSSRTYRTLAKLMTDTQQVSRETEQRKSTFHARSPAFRIDHIFVSPHFTCLRAEVRKDASTEIASDHLPVFAEVALSALSSRSQPAGVRLTF